MTTMVSHHNEDAWWKEAVVYQIYPRSFKDSNNDGIGDLKGAMEKLDYLKSLGVDVIWFSPIYESPMVDMGYDISDYRSIHHEFGTMKDWELLCEQVHKRGMKLMMDLVVNHTSDQHKWFQDSCEKKNGKDDWYIWRKPRFVNGERKEPTNWISCFGGSTWKYHEGRGEYYLHCFAAEQPDLNWENEQVRQEVYDTMRFWMDKGCDGFRMDVINMISKDPRYLDAPITCPDSLYQPGFQYIMNGPRVHEYLREMNEQVYSKYPNSINVGEAPMANVQDGLQYVGASRKEMQMIFHFEHVEIDATNGNKYIVKDWILPELKTIFNRWQNTMQKGNGWNSLYLENHDQPRSVSRYADDGEYRDESVKMLATFHLSLSGTVFLFQGQEIGMVNKKKWGLEDIRDIDAINYYNDTLNARCEHSGSKKEDVDMSDILDVMPIKNRDNARTPVQWTDEAYAGFSESEPWISVNDDYKEYNVASQVGVEGSHFEYYKKMLRVRKEHKTLTYGVFEDVDHNHLEVYAFTRTGIYDKYLVVCNFSQDTVQWKVPDHVERSGEFVIGSYDEQELSSVIELRPYEARVYKVVDKLFFVDARREEC
ncbi:oligo-1,6-glucosidase [Acrasis kona]|uniref:Oligo-1,6-glucosidase n=1 Tax=Acrasis kona TaxID=1008807 RepID=A0AAW2ZAK4_9EUKA